MAPIVRVWQSTGTPCPVGPTSRERHLETLLVDDSPVVRLHLTRLLAARGHQVTALDSGEAAWDRCQDRLFELIILDWHLPGMDGITLCRHIRALPQSEYSVILFLTAREDPKSLSRALEAGANDYLPKSAGSGALDIRLTVAEQQVAERARRRQAEAALRQERDMLQQLMDTMPDLIYFKDRQSRFTRVNRALAQSYGVARCEDLVGKSDFDFHPHADAASYFANEQGMMGGGRALVNHYEDVSGRLGREYWLLSTKVPLLRDGEVTGMVGISRDITAQRQGEEALRASEAHFRRLIELAPVGAYIVDERGVYETVNRAYAGMLGYTPAEMLGRHFSMVVPPGLRAQAMPLFLEVLATDGETQTERTGITKNGTLVTLLFSSMPLVAPDGRTKRAYFALDITERKRAEQRLAELAHFDRLTGLANRTLFTQRLDEALAPCAEPVTPCALLFLDLDGFKAVNDTLGHAVGDQLLQVVAGLLVQCVREGDLVARLAGDEFTVLLRTPDAEAAAQRVGRLILEALSGPLQVGAHSVRVGVSIGAACFPRDARDRSSLLSAADAAMYAAKREGKHRMLLTGMAPD